MKDYILSLRNVTKIFATKSDTFKALDDVSFDVKRGEVFGIIGASGAGKSTLLRTINLLEQPDSGKVVFDGIDLCKLTERELREKRKLFGMVFQQFNLLMQSSVLENVCFPLRDLKIKKKDRTERGLKLLEMVGLSDKASSYPAKLSGGQKQRVGIARAIAANPKILLCDEPTSALDPDSTRSVLNLLKRVNQEFGITVVIITHEMKVVEEICDRAAILDNGKIVECGGVREIFSGPKSEAGKKLIYPLTRLEEKKLGGRRYRLVFNGENVASPVIANMILKFEFPVSIIHADTQVVDGKIFGQMILEFPQNKIAAESMVDYLKKNGLTVQEI